MSEQEHWWTAATNLLSGSFWTMMGAMMGRMMYHGSEVRARRRKMFGKELIWELPVVFGMYWITKGAAMKLQLGYDESVALSVMLGYVGPRVIDAAVAKWLDGKK